MDLVPRLLIRTAISFREGITRPSATRAKRAFGRPESNPRGHDVRIYECHIRCGTTYTFNEESMLRFYLRAFGEGNPAWIAGVDSLA